MALSALVHGYRFGESDWEDINDMKFSLSNQAGLLQDAFSKFNRPLNASELLDHLESTYPAYFEAFSVPPAEDDMILIGESGRAIGHTYLISRWLSGQDAGVLRDHPMVIVSRSVWELSMGERKTLKVRWTDEVLEAQIKDILDAGARYNMDQRPLSVKFQQRTRQILYSKRIIACTTTGAANFRDAIQYAGPDVLVVEEAGEVLESHVLTALSNDTEQLILIGDHKYVVIPCLHVGIDSLTWGIYR